MSIFYGETHSKDSCKMYLSVYTVLILGKLFYLFFKKIYGKLTEWAEQYILLYFK